MVSDVNFAKKNAARKRERTMPGRVQSMVRRRPNGSTIRREMRVKMKLTMATRLLTAVELWNPSEAKRVLWCDQLRAMPHKIYS